MTLKNELWELPCHPSNVLTNKANTTKYVVSRQGKNYDSRSFQGITKTTMDLDKKIWGSRLKEVRLQSGLSQKQLGIAAGLDEFVASTRINRYELGIHKADFQIATKLGEILNVPASYFYEEDDKLSELIILYYRANNKEKNELLKTARSFAE